MNDQNSHLTALLQQGTELMNHGKLAEAKHLFTQICEANPQNAEAWHLLGTVNGRMGDIATAGECCRHALDLQPDHRAARVNMGNVLYSQGRLYDAISEYQRALQLDPGFAEVHNKLGIALASSGNMDQALECFHEAARLKPNYADAYRNMGYVHVQQGEQDKALAAFWQALDLIPDSAETHNDIGAIYFEKDNIEQAIPHFQRALEINPSYLPALNNLGKACRTPERFSTYFTLYRKAIDLFNDPEQARTNFIENIRSVRPQHYDPWLNQELIKCFSMPTADYRAIAFFTAQHLLNKYNIDSLLSHQHVDLQNVTTLVAADSLFLTFLEKTINVNADMELFLTKLRRAVLFKHSHNSGLDKHEQNLVTALAYQCFYNEYVFETDAEERRLVSKLTTAIEQSSAHDSTIYATLESQLCVFGMYEPLHSLACRRKLSVISPSNWTDKFNSFLQETLIASLEEDKIKEQISTLGKVNNPTSQIVQSQYEENPYPRWLSLPKIEETTPKQHVTHLFPSFPLPNFMDGPINILVAGCGTGRQPIQEALTYPHAEILAVDISTSSLAYAIRMARQYQVKNIQFAQGDILELSNLNRKFHLIKCTGVLHHMQDPIAGWKVLIDLLAEDGLMTIALYSEMARKEIVAAREAIKNEHLLPNKENIRHFRSKILNQQIDHSLYTITRNGDFYTTSRCRDLLFHFMEHRFTLPQIEQILHDLHLDFIGFEFPNEPINNDTVRKYRTNFPEDPRMTNLALWDRFETLYPDTFIRMYNFWCQKLE